MRLLPMLLQPVRSFAGLGLRSVADVLGLSRLGEEDTMHDRGRGNGCSIRLLCYCGSLHGVIRTGRAGVRRVATEMDGASALDGSISIVGEGIRVDMSRSASTRAGFHIAIRVGESIAVVDSRCGRGAVGCEVGSIDSMAA